MSSVVVFGHNVGFNSRRSYSSSNTNGKFYLHFSNKHQTFVAQNTEIVRYEGKFFLLDSQRFRHMTFSYLYKNQNFVVETKCFLYKIELLSNVNDNVEENLISTDLLVFLPKSYFFSYDKGVFFFFFFSVSFRIF